MQQLFSITTQIANLHGYKDVEVNWFVEKRVRHLFGPDGSLGVGYREVIIGYDERDDCKCDSEEAVEELFTEAEANSFVAWLRANRNGSENTMVKAEALPIGNNVMGFGAVALGGGTDHLLTGDSEDYDLPFKVYGYYDVRDHKFDETLPGAQRALRGVNINNGKIEPWYLADEDHAL